MNRRRSKVVVESPEIRLDEEAEEGTDGTGYKEKEEAVVAAGYWQANFVVVIENSACYDSVYNSKELTCVHKYTCRETFSYWVCNFNTEVKGD
jgi:hypothetical protein